MKTLNIRLSQRPNQRLSCYKSIRLKTPFSRQMLKLSSSVWHVLKLETPKRNRQNEIAKTKSPKRKGRNKITMYHIHYLFSTCFVTRFGRSVLFRPFRFDGFVLVFRVLIHALQKFYRLTKISLLPFGTKFLLNFDKIALLLANLDQERFHAKGFRSTFAVNFDYDWERKQLLQ